MWCQQRFALDEAALDMRNLFLVKHTGPHKDLQRMLCCISAGACQLSASPQHTYHGWRAGVLGCSGGQPICSHSSKPQLSGSNIGAQLSYQQDAGDMASVT